MRFGSYKLFIALTAGRLGKGNRIPLPACVKEAARQKWPTEGIVMAHEDGYLSEDEQ